MVKNLPANTGDAGFDLWVRKRREWQPILGLPKNGQPIFSSIFAREVPWTKEPGELQSMGSQKGPTRLSD